jgi:hypothetical protein
VEGKSNKQGLRFVLQPAEQGNAGYLVWGKDHIEVHIDWRDPVVCHGLKHHIKFTRLLRRRASSERAEGADCQGYRRTKQRLANQERKLAAHRKSLHGRLVHEIVSCGNRVTLEKVSYKAWQKQYGKSVGRCAPGMFVELLKRTRASNRRHPA